MIYLITYWALSYALSLFLAGQFIKAPQLQGMVRKVPRWLIWTAVSYLALSVCLFVGIWYVFWAFRKFLWKPYILPLPIVKRYQKWKDNRQFKRHLATMEKDAAMAGPPEDEPWPAGETETELSSGSPEDERKGDGHTTTHGPNVVNPERVSPAIPHTGEDIGPGEPW